MATLNTKNRYILSLLFLILINCKTKKVDKSLPLYQFNPEITFTGFEIKELKLVTFNLNKYLINGKILINNIQNKNKIIGSLSFESIKDTIYKKDTLIMKLTNKEYNFTEIRDRLVKVSLGNDRRGIIEFKIDSKKFIKKGIIIKK